MAGHLLFNSGSNESSLAPQFKWLDNTFKVFLIESDFLKVIDGNLHSFSINFKKLNAYFFLTQLQKLFAPFKQISKS